MELQKPAGVKIALTDRCNQKCVFCYNSREIEQTFDKDIENMSRMVSILGENEVLFIKLTGGEPLLNRELLYPAIEKAKEYNMFVAINTNLSLLTEEDLKRFRKNNVVKINVSFQSHQREKHNRLTGSKNYDKVLNNLKKLAKEDIEVEVGMTVTKDNMNDVYDTGRMIFERTGIKRFNAFPIGPVTQDQTAMMPDKNNLLGIFNQMKRLKDKFGLSVSCANPTVPCYFKDLEVKDYLGFFNSRCNMGKRELSLDTHGNIRPCTAVDIVEGNILKNGWADIIKVFNKYKKLYNNRKKLLPPECRTCYYVEKCHGGCKSANLCLTGKIFGRNRYMRGPLRAPFVIQRDLSELLSKKYKICPALSYRKEKEGFLVCSKGSYFVVSDVEFELLRALGNKDEIIPYLLLTHIKDRKPGIATLEKFINNGALVGGGETDG